MKLPHPAGGKDEIEHDGFRNDTVAIDPGAALRTNIHECNTSGL
jgi:hypothetical protein